MNIKGYIAVNEARSDDIANKTCIENGYIVYRLYAPVVSFDCRHHYTGLFALGIIYRKGKATKLDK